MLDTEDLPAIDSVRKKTGLNILPRLTDDDSIKHALQQYQKSLKDEFGDLIATEAGRIKLVKEADGNEASGDDLKKMAEDLPIVRIGRHAPSSCHHPKVLPISILSRWKKKLSCVIALTVFFMTR